MHLRIPHSALVSLTALAALFTACKRNAATDENPEVVRLNTELAVAREKLALVEKALVTKHADQAFVTAAETAKTQPVEEGSSAIQKDAQIRALQAELAALKKSDAVQFAQASAAQQKESAAVALERYQKFFRDFPQSPLAADADRAISELTQTADREARALVRPTDPRQSGREILRQFAEGGVTMKEIAPLLRGRSRGEIVKLLGPPGQTFRDGKELGYVDKVLDPATGRKETLVIGFDSDTVASLRMGYVGKPIKP